MDWEVGPFFCGINRLVVIPEFNIRLNSPTSTTKQIEVANRFGGDEGVVIQLNNNGYQQSHGLRSFNCSWLSDYSGEDERIWIGGEYPIKIETIRTLSNSANYIDYFRPFFYFDCMINGVIKFDKS